MSGPAEIAVVGPAGDPRTADLHGTALQAAPPGAVIALGDGSGAGDADGIPLLAGRGLVGGAPAAYVCRSFACLAPVTDAGGAPRRAVRRGAPGDGRGSRGKASEVRCRCGVQGQAAVTRG